jgi:site-specific recombinase XerD
LIVSVYHPHCLWATTATLVHEGGVHPDKIQKLLDHKKPKTTQGYNKQKVKPRDSASHAMPL